MRGKKASEYVDCGGNYRFDSVYFCAVALYVDSVGEYVTYMKDYILTIFISSLIMTVIQILCGSRGATKPYLHFIMGLITVLVLLNPFLSVVKSITDGVTVPKVEDTVFEFDSGEGTVVSLAEKQISIKINQMLRDEFGVIAENIKVVLQYDSKGTLFYIRRIDVMIQNEDLSDLIRDFLEKEFETEVSIHVKGERHEASE